MAKIVYSMAGEGRGHATRVRTIVEELRQRHEIILFASGVAFQFLADLYRAEPNVRVHPIRGLEFKYSQGRLDYLKSVMQSAPFLWTLADEVARVEQILRGERPDLAVTDFEPILPRAAARRGLPFISFDHQHFLTVSDLSSLPFQLRLKAACIAASVRWFYTGQEHTIVSSFFTPPLRRQMPKVTQVGVLLREEILRAAPVNERHLLVYMRRSARPNLLEALRVCGREVHIYGLGERPRDGNLHFLPIDEARFLDDLVTCHAVVSNAGNQLLGESLYLYKPVLALPESGNFEQAVNGHFLEQSGGGLTRDYDRLTFNDLREFLDQVPALRRRIDTSKLAGNAAAIAVLEGCLAGTSSAAASAEPVPSATLFRPRPSVARL